MRTKLYVITAQSTDPYKNLALEELLLSKTAPNSVILYLWQNDHTVVIGRNQNPWAECRTELLQADGGKLVRRLSGGGAVYHDLGNLNFTFLCSEADYDLHKQLSVIQTACKLAGIDAVFSGRNDLLVDGRKFSGNAFYHSKGAAYHHGTLLVSSDLDKLQKYLSPPKAKLESKGIASVRSRVTNLNAFSPDLTCDDMKRNMIAAFQQVYNSVPETLTLTADDQVTITNLTNHYNSHEWLFGKTVPMSCTMEGHFTWGHLQLLLHVENGEIQNVVSYTDATDHTLPQILSDALSGCRFHFQDMANAVSSLSFGQDIISLFDDSLW